MASALVKIAYGLAGQEKKSGDSEKRNPNLEAVGAMGIFDGSAARSFAIASYSGKRSKTRAVNKKNLKGAMRWDLWNPWAKWYELNSTHPLVANRLLYLSDQAVKMGQKPYVVFNEVRPESYWDEFFTDLFIYLLPVIMFILLLLSLFAGFFGIVTPIGNILLPVSVALLGAALLLRFRFSYRGRYFPEMSIASLLKKVKVSKIRPVPCTLQGTIIGRGIPGYIFSEDFVMKDGTGIIFLDYRQPLGIWEFFFGLLKAGEYQGKKVVVKGWYRRSPVPFLEIKAIDSDGKVNKSWVPFFYRLSAMVFFFVGAIWTLIAIT